MNSSTRGYKDASTSPTVALDETSGVLRAPPAVFPRACGALNSEEWRVCRVTASLSQGQQ